MQDEKQQDGLVAPSARSTMPARCLSHAAGKCPRAFLGFRIGINNMTAVKALGFALTSFSRAFFHQPGDSEAFGFAFSFIALVLPSPLRFGMALGYTRSLKE
jgi:hypothetical protein